LGKINNTLAQIGARQQSAQQVEHYYTTDGAFFLAPGVYSGCVDFMYLQLCPEAEAVIRAKAILTEIAYLETKKGELKNAGFHFEDAS